MLCYNLAASLTACKRAVNLGAARLLFLSQDHYFACSPGRHLDILVNADMGFGGACGRLLTFDPTGLPGFQQCNVARVCELMDAIAGVQVGGGGMLQGVRRG